MLEQPVQRRLGTLLPWGHPKPSGQNALGRATPVEQGFCWEVAVSLHFSWSEEKHWEEKANKGNEESEGAAMLQ